MVCLPILTVKVHKAPPCAETICRAIVSPSPVPRATVNLAHDIVKGGPQLLVRSPRSEILFRSNRSMRVRCSDVDLPTTHPRRMGANPRRKVFSVITRGSRN